MALGHEVRLIAPIYVNPFVKRQKNDKNDAAAICEAPHRPGLRFLKVRSIANQAMLMEYKARLGKITKMGNGYLRKLLVVGVHAVLVHHARHSDHLLARARKLLETKPFKLVAVATANKLARMAFALMSQNTRYHTASSLGIASSASPNSASAIFRS